MSKSSATDQHGNWRTVPEVQIRDAIRMKAEEAAHQIAIGNGRFIEGQDTWRDIIDSTLRAALAEKESGIAELVGAVKNFLANRYSLNAEMDLEKILAKHAKPTVTT